jgi:nicotinamide-nucleotide amidase
VELLVQRGITLATAESCTGGLVGFLVTSVPGASAVYREGFVTYAGKAKVRELGVDPVILERHGEVSAETARAMAEGAAARAGCRAAVAVTGIAGPGGGTDEKPVGLVYIAARLDGKTVFRELRFGGDREMVRKRAAMAALDLLRRLILGVDDQAPQRPAGAKD